MKKSLDITKLSSNQQIALWAIFDLNQKSFYSSEVASSKYFTDEGKKAIGGILSSLYRNGYIEKVSGGRNKLWRLADEVVENKEMIKKKIAEVKTYWR